jgi:hypothetical protein
MFRIVVLVLVLVGAIVACVNTVWAQADILLLPDVNGNYSMGCQDTDNPDLHEMCVRRLDVTPPLDLACMSVDGELAPGGTARFVFPLEVTPDQNAHVRCFATDTSNNVSAQSPNEGEADFTPPSAPLAVP